MERAPWLFSYPKGKGQNAFEYFSIWQEEQSVAAADNNNNDDNVDVDVDVDAPMITFSCDQ